MKFLPDLSPFLNLRLHYLYAFLAVPLVLGSAFVVPPLRVPDEQGHFFRAAHVATGGLIESAREEIPGGYLNVGLIAFEAILNEHNPDAVRETEWARAESIGWRNDERWVKVGTARYPPFLYVPQAAGLLLGHIVGLGILNSFFLARVMNGLVAIAISCFALSLCRRGKLFLFSLALLPMAIFMMGSCSQDAGVIALSLLCAALITRGPSSNRRDYILLTCSIALLALSRAPLIGLLMLLWLPMWRANRIVSIKAQLIASICCVLGLCGWYVATLLLQGPILPGPAASSASQLAFLRAHPFALFSIPWNTLTTAYEDWYEMFIGRLGWLDIALPAYAYLCGGVLLVAGTLVCIIERISNSIWDRVFILASFSVVLLLMLWTFYLAWTPVGAATIIGMQGRYLFAIIPLLITITPSFELRNKRLAEMLTASLAVLCVGIVVFLAIISLREVRQHYRIAGRTTSFIQLSLSISEIQKR